MAAILYDDLEPPLCVDLDGTLINTDLLVESLFGLLRQAPITVMTQAPLWLLHGTAYLKEQIACRVQIDATVLPYHAEFLAYLRQHHARGRRLVLATASHLRFAEQVASYLGIFESVLATEHGQNLSRARKGACLVARYGERGFDYAGNSRADLAVWPLARAAILVNPVWGVTRRAHEQVPITAIFDDRHNTWSMLRQALHLPLWLNNLIIFVPLLLEQRYLAVTPIIHAGLAFLAFGLCVSSSTLLTDLLNLARDRQLPHKCNAPLVAGTISIIHCVALVPALLGVAIVLVIPLPPLSGALLASDYLLHLANLQYFEQIVALHVLLRAGLYTMRLIVGYMVIGATISLSLVVIAFLLFCVICFIMPERHSLSNK